MLTTYLERNVVSEIDVGFPLHAPTFDDDLYIIIANEFGMTSDDDRPWNGEILLAAVRVGSLGFFFFLCILARLARRGGLVGFVALPADLDFGERALMNPADDFC